MSIRAILHHSYYTSFGYPIKTKRKKCHENGNTSDLPLQSELDVEGDGGAGVDMEYVEHFRALVTPRSLAMTTARANTTSFFGSCPDSHRATLGYPFSQLDPDRSPRSPDCARTSPDTAGLIETTDA